MTASVKYIRHFGAWLFNDARRWEGLSAQELARLDRLRTGGFILFHLSCLGVLFVGFSLFALWFAIALYIVRMFFITAFYHRYFSHRAYKVNRLTQFAMAVAGCTAGQRGPLWWAAHHRDHHRFADTAADPHSPDHRGLFYSHTLWFLTRGSFVPPADRVSDWRRYPELRLLEKLDWVPFAALGAGCAWLGGYLESHRPEWGTDAWQLVVWGFVISTLALYHATYTINSLAHRYGARRYDTCDSSRNNMWLAILTLGEGWHNNHHRHPARVKLGVRWWELDLGYLGLRGLAALGLVRELKVEPAAPHGAYREAVG